MTIKPLALKKGDLIGIISPAGPITTENKKNFEQGINILKKMGYNVVLGKYTYYNKGYLAGTDKQRAFDLMSMFKNKHIKAIFCSRGGYGTERLLDYIDFQIIKRNPKIFVGYSNITLLLNILYQFANLVTFHGPMVKDLYSYKLQSTKYNINCLFETLTVTKQGYKISPLPSQKFKTLVPGKSQGILVGGNLTTLISTMGTKYEIDTKNKILLIEDINEPVYSIDRMLTLLKNSGKLRDCNGIIIGNFTNCENSYGQTVNKILKDILIPLGKPVLLNFSAGHGQYNTTLPIGVNVELDTANCSLKILESVIR